MSEECQHDWRVVPYLVVPHSIPPKVFVVCAKCEKKAEAPYHFMPKVSRRHEIVTWKKYTGEATNL